MDRHFLYLPIYLAQFDHPSSRKQPFFGMLPPQYSVEVRIPQRESDRNDAGVFNCLMDARLDSSDIMFAACDPTVLLDRQSEGARMAASIITSLAFWAVDHDAQNVRLVSDLARFERILCYEERTTSNLIARRIAKRDIAKLEVVRSTDEIRALDSFGEGTLAISPEVLRIANLIHGPKRPGERSARIVLDLCATKEFSNVLTTALFTRADVIAKHPDLVSGVLGGLQKALMAIHAGSPLVPECAIHNFTDAFCLDQALAIATEGNVFPETIQVRRDRWLRACDFSRVSHAMADGQSKRKMSPAEERNANELYEQVVLDVPLQQLVRRAITSAYGDVSGEISRAADNNSIFGPISLRAILPCITLLVAGLLVGYASAIVTTPAAVTLSSWGLLVLICWLFGRLIGFEVISVPYVLHCIALPFAWWGVHESIVPPRIAGAHFVPGLSLDGNAPGAIIGVTLALWGILVTWYWTVGGRDHAA